MGVTIAVTRVAANVGVGNQTITTADLGGLTPKAALFIITEGSVSGTPAAHAVLGFGAADSSSQWALTIRSRDGQASTDTVRRAMTDECITIINAAANTIDGEASFVAFGANNVTINWGNAPAAAYLLTVVFFAGSDLDADVSVFQMPNVLNGAVDVNGVGFNPDAVFLGTHCVLFDDATWQPHMLSFGVAINGGGQFSHCQREQTGQAAGAPGARISTLYGVMQPSTVGAVDWGGEIGGYDAQGFSCTNRIGASNDQVGYLAIKLNDRALVSAGIIDSPIANGNQAIVAPGFTPQAVIVGLTNLPNIDTGSATGDAGTYGISTIDADDEYCNSIQIEDASATTDTQSLSDSTAINLPQDDGTAGYVASFVSFDVAGWTWNFTAQLGTVHKWWYVAFSETLPLVITLGGRATPTNFQQTGLSISTWKPTIVAGTSYTPRGVLIDGALQERIASYNHEIAAEGGYQSASMVMKGDQNYVEDWLENGVGRHIEVYNPSLDRIWEGFVNGVSATVGRLAVSRGPMIDIANRTLAIYTVVDTSTNPPLTGPSGLVTALVNDATSQDRYGIWEKPIDAGTVTVLNATTIRDSYLEEHKQPETSQDFGSGGDLSVTVECLGYWAFFLAYTYAENANSGTRTVTLKIQDIINADTNGIFSTDFSRIDTNGLLVPRYDDTESLAWELLKSLTSLGDASSVRYTLGVYESQQIEYTEMPEEIAYQQRLSDEQVEVYVDGGLVEPWNVKPARWLFYSDFLTGKIRPTTLSERREDPRFEFIESVRFTAPYGIQHSGGKVNTLPQLLAQLGLGVASA